MKMLALLVIVCSSLTLHAQSTAIKIISDSVPTLKKETPSFVAQNSNPFAIVAGGSKGIGYAIAEALALRKYNLILIARHLVPLQEAKKKIRINLWRSG